ncbi:MAG: CHASE2 domain-containing protein [Cyanobacteria bacterium P01_F01_bin.150]
MTKTESKFRLRVQQVERTCLFELSWGNGQQISAQVALPDGLMQQYRLWKQAYLDFYQYAPQFSNSKRSVRLSAHVEAQHPNASTSQRPDLLRGRTLSQGEISVPSPNWHTQLVQAEATLLSEFQQWLRQRELFDIRSAIAQSLTDTSLPKDLTSHRPNGPTSTTVFLICTPLDLARFPWESWELGTEFGVAKRIAIVRSPANIHFEAHTQPPRRRRPRILAILGDETGLDFQADRKAVQSCEKVADIQFVGWQPGQSITELKTHICQTIAEPEGWDVLFFAGHSNETQITGGELAIAPGASFLIREITPYLITARQQGLQVAIFNSCSGLNIAESLVNLGFSQVVVMREPIHNRVAQAFLTRFLQSLASHEDVQDSLLAATQYLQASASLTYPSAYLIPTLFRHYQSTLFRIEPSGVMSQLRKWLPIRYEAIALTLLAAISWPLSVQNQLVEQRTLVQAQYRQLTQRANTIEPPPVALVRIDNESLQRRGISAPKPISQVYLADIIKQLTPYGPEVIGIDYILDRPNVQEAPQLAMAIEEAIAKGTAFVFASYREDGKWVKASPDIAPEIAGQSIAGDISGWTLRMSLPRWVDDGPRPLSYESVRLKVPNLLNYGRTQRGILTFLSYRFKQRWLDPLIDYSLPPHQVYEEVPAWTLFDGQVRPQLGDLDQQVVLLVPGGYAEAGIKDGEDNRPPTLAMRYWYEQRNPIDGRQRNLTGGEIHAYRLHHFMTQRLVIPIPDLWLLLLASLLGKAIALQWQKPHNHSGNHNPWHWVGIGIGGSFVYGIISLELYLSSTAILLPISVPLLALWLYIAPMAFSSDLRRANR